MKISIVTATYNRRDLLPRLYQSILENSKTYQELEWLIMDDGSKISPEDLVLSWQKEAPFPIHFYKQKNAGKMSALNQLVPKVTGDIIIEMDDDDYFMKHVFEVIASDYEKIQNDDGVYGIIYEKKLTSHNKEIPNNFNGSIKKLYDLHYRENVDFDMVLTFKSDYRKQFHYILEENEKFSTEARMYYRMDESKNGMLIKTRPIMVCEYQEDGYTKGLHQVFKNNPKGYYQFFQEALNYNMNGVLFKRRIYLIKHYILFSHLTNTPFHEMIQSVHGWNRFLTFFLYIPGIIVSKRKFGD